MAKLAPEVVVVSVPRRGPASRLFVPLAFAAGLLLAVLGALVWNGMPYPTQTQTITADALDEAIRLHDDWVSQAQALAAPAALPAGSFAPELVSAGLTLSMVKPDAHLGGLPALQAGYVGRHGCRLSLFEMRSEDGEEGFSVAVKADLQSATWANGRFRYILVARQMDEARFAMIAGVLRAMTGRQGEDADLEVVARLQTARQPCLG
ncbi:anti-sigma factor [Mesorhizobium tianshanense]|nr:anti-sigma factor [Mesorhizobium tianshanense]